jgi:hypothetical protein
VLCCAVSRCVVLQVMPSKQVQVQSITLVRSALAALAALAAFLALLQQVRGRSGCMSC